MRFRVSPEVTIALGMAVPSLRIDQVGTMTEMLASRTPKPGEMEAYERLLGDAMAGDLRSSRAKTMSKRRGELSIRC